MQDEREERCYKVVHSRDNVESVYLVTATSSRQAIQHIKCETAEICGHYDHKDCGFSAELFKPDPPYFLYAINKESGEMSFPTVSNERSMCIVCLGNVP